MKNIVEVAKAKRTEIDAVKVDRNVKKDKLPEESKDLLDKHAKKVKQNGKL